jgi:hypothetical protein
VTHKFIQLVATVALIALPTPGFSQALDSDPNALDTAEAIALDASIYARIYGVSEAEALRRLLIMTEAGEEVRTKANDESTSFAGAYFDNGPEFAVVIRSKKPGNRVSTIARAGRSLGLGKDPAAKQQRKAARKAARAANRLTDAQVEAAEAAIESPTTAKVKVNGGAKHSRQEGLDALTQAIPKLQAISGFQAAFFDTQTGEIAVMIDTTANSGAASQITNAVSFPTRLEDVPGGFQPASVRGGQALLIGTAHDCMSSFVAERNSDKRLGIVTAGHCVNPSYNTKDSAGAAATLNEDPLHRRSDYTMDLAFYAGTGTTPVYAAEFFADGTTTPRKVTGARSRATTTASDGTAIAKGTTKGSFICHLGQTARGSGVFVQTCGEVISTGSDNVYGKGTPGNYVIVRNTQTGAGTVRTTGNGTLTCFPGDSGGPWFANTIAYGVMSTCAWVGGSQANPVAWSAFTSTDYFSTLGVTLIVPTP